MAQDTANHPDSPSWFGGVFWAFIQGGDDKFKIIRLFCNDGSEAIGVITSTYDDSQWHSHFSGWKRVYTELHPPSVNELGAYSKNESDKRFQPKGEYQPKGDYAAADHAYSKDESDRRYLSHDTAIPPAANLSGYATQQWVGANYPSRNEVASDERIVKGPALKYIDGNPTTSVSIPSGGFLLRMSITNHQYDMQYGFIQVWLALTGSLLRRGHHES